jgi:hypothetical protein
MGNPVTTESASHNDGLSVVGCITKIDRVEMEKTRAVGTSIRVVNCEPDGGNVAGVRSDPVYPSGQRRQGTEQRGKQ